MTDKGGRYEVFILIKVAFILRSNLINQTAADDTLLGLNLASV
jgi:hypothetical protein